MNSVNVIGRLTKEPELRYTPKNTKAVANFILAVDNIGSGTSFIPVVCWNSTAEFVNKNFHKGLRVGVTGSLKSGTWKDDNGKNNYKIEIVAEHVCFADKFNSNEECVPKSDDIEEGEEI